jgi:hypothetical protein
MYARWRCDCLVLEPCECISVHQIVIHATVSDAAAGGGPIVPSASYPVAAPELAAIVATAATPMADVSEHVEAGVGATTTTTSQSLGGRRARGSKHGAISSGGGVGVSQDGVGWGERGVAGGADGSPPNVISDVSGGRLPELYHSEEPSLPPHEQQQHQVRSTGGVDVGGSSGGVYRLRSSSGGGAMAGAAVAGSSKRGSASRRQHATNTARGGEHQPLFMDTP